MDRLILLLFAVPLAAAEPPKPKTLTAKEITDGWVMLFDGESTFGWTFKDGVEVKDGKLLVGHSKPGSASYDYVPAGTMRGEGVDFKHAGGGYAILAYNNPSSTTSLAVKPKDLQPLFNGKDLSGWKIFDGDPKRKASKWAVTKDDELHVTNGPGDLQTDKQYADFLLQFECKTNGPALNSGVFFRCRANEYQQGYEAQIQNAIVNDDRTRPLDFGTGAIYRRVKARKVVSDDNEWFTMTVMAVGPNLRTWVNGYPVVNWTDDRPPADNARNGQYLNAGHISFQGHDPTTDILFRNIRIVEIKK